MTEEKLSNSYDYRMYEVRVERLFKDNSPKRMTIQNASDTAKLFADLKNKDRECLLCAHLNVKNSVIGLETVAIGTLTSNLVHPREVFKGAIINGACGIVLVHNHPSEDPEPSGNDIKITKELVKAGEIIGIELLDHIIIAGDKYKSLKESNLM